MFLSCVSFSDFSTVGCSSFFSSMPFVSNPKVSRPSNIWFISAAVASTAEFFCCISCNWDEDLNSSPFPSTTFPMWTCCWCLLARRFLTARFRTASSLCFVAASWTSTSTNDSFSSSTSCSSSISTCMEDNWRPPRSMGSAGVDKNSLEACREALSSNLSSFFPLLMCVAIKPWMGTPNKPAMNSLNVSKWGNDIFGPTICCTLFMTTSKSVNLSTNLSILIWTKASGDFGFFQDTAVTTFPALPFMTTSDSWGVCHVVCSHPLLPKWP